MTARPTPLLGDVSLQYVQTIEHHLDGGFQATGVIALPGELQQRAARPSHRIRLTGVLFGASRRGRPGRSSRTPRAPGPS